MCTQADHIGTTNVPTNKHTVVMNAINGTYSVGDVLSSELHVLNCAALAKGKKVAITQVSIWEKSPAGTQVKPGVRLHFSRGSYVPPAQNAPFKGPLATDYLNYGHSIDVATGDYVEIGDGAGTDPDYAKAVVVITNPKTIRSNNDDNALYMLVEMLEAKTLASGSIMVIELETELY